MFTSLRNLAVYIIAAFIPDRDARHKFRNKYKIKTKFRKLRDDNIRLIREVEGLKEHISSLMADYNQRLEDLERDSSHNFRIAPLDDSPAHGPDSNVFLAIACVSKNEAPYLKEWIEYHKIVGVERFYFYDNESNDETKEILAPYIKDGTVVYHYLPNHPITKRLPQIEAYCDAIFKYRDRTRWMAIIDVDEFIVPVEKNTIPEFLADYDQHQAVVVNWVCFDSNGHDKKPTAHGGLVTANYTRTLKDHNASIRDRFVKSIVNPKMVISYVSPHHGLYYENMGTITENFQRTRGVATKIHSSSKIRINHYKSKSREEYVNRVIKNSNNSIHQFGFKFNESWLNFPEETVKDVVIQKYVPKLKRALGITD